MKSSLFVLLALLAMPVANGQTTALEYINKAPKIPDKIWAIDMVAQKQFLTVIDDLSDTIESDVRARKQAAEDYMNAHKQEMQRHMIAASGMSANDVAKMQSGKKLTDAEKRAMAEKMMQQQTGMNMADVDKLKGMSEAEKQAWAQQYASGQKAGIQSGKVAAPPSNNGKAMYDLLAEQKQLLDKVQAKEAELNQRFAAIDNAVQPAKAKLDSDLAPLYLERSKINDGEGSTQADVEHEARLNKQILALQTEFCKTQTPALIDFLGQCKAAYTELFPTFDRIEEIQVQVTAMQTSTEPMAVGRGVESLLAVERYLTFLDQVFRYKYY